MSVYVKVSREEMTRIRALAASRKAKREEKRSSLPWGRRPPKPPRRPQRTGPIAQVSSKKSVKEEIVRLLGLLDKTLNGESCRLGHLCPAFRDQGSHRGQLGYHLIPQKRGDATRFLPENVVWACSRANNGERWNRDLYRQHHVLLFGEPRIARLEALSHTIRHYSRAEILELRAETRRTLELAVKNRTLGERP